MPSLLPIYSLSGIHSCHSIGKLFGCQTEKEKLLTFLFARLIQFSIYQETRKLENSSEFLKKEQNIQRNNLKKINKNTDCGGRKKKYKKIKMEKNNARVAFATFAKCLQRKIPIMLLSLSLLLLVSTNGK